jgi:ABC-type multidrug transport system ATPase subunit
LGLRRSEGWGLLSPPPEPRYSPLVPNLRFGNLRRRFGRLAVLTGVSGAVAPGGLLHVTGPNGSGKSTLLRCLSGLLAPDSGAVEYEEAGVVLDAAERRRRVGVVAPDLAFYAELSVRENLEFFARLRRVPASRGLAVLDRFGLPLERLAGALSSGMRQRLRWGWALLHSPALLLLDEPFQNFDAPGERIARELLADHLAAGGLAVVANPSALDFDHAERLDLGG